MVYLLLAIYLSYVTVDNIHSFKSSKSTMGACMDKEKSAKQQEDRALANANHTATERQPIIQHI